MKKRVIFTLLYDNEQFKLSRNFRLQKVGDLRWLKKNYNFSKIAFSIDELIILDVSRNDRDEEKFRDHVRALTEECFVPIAAGGGIRSLEQARQLLRSGADKVVVNSLVGLASDVILDIAEEFGSQSIVISVDVKKIDGCYTVWAENGSAYQDIKLTEWLNKIESLPVGEIYLNSIDRDGTGQGYDMALLDSIPESISNPLILAGGAGNFNHFSQGLNDSRVDAVATAHLFNFVGNGLEISRISLRNSGFNLAKWDIEKAVNLNGFFMTGY